MDNYDANQINLDENQIERNLMEHIQLMTTLSKDINGHRTSVWNLNGIFIFQSSKFISVNNPT
jgi:hypothetical protein